MELIAIKDVQRKDNPLLYRRDFVGKAVISYPVFDKKQEIEFAVDFSIEDTALGGARISATIPEKIDYPLVPVLRMIKEYITQLEGKGQFQ